MIKYIHYRYKRFDGTPHTKGGETFAYVVHANGSVTVARALCNPKDNYCKRIGRDISTGRLIKGHGKTIAINNKKLVDSILDANWE